MAMVSKQELVLPLIGCVFFIELFTSAAQTYWFKYTRKRSPVQEGTRLFSMSPIHHGYERHGYALRRGGEARTDCEPWHEVTVVTRLWIIAALGAMAGLALLKVR
jgi:phospho-N-acetylmuramoyl-pentapeptide-transferase